MTLELAGVVMNILYSELHIPTCLSRMLPH